MNIVKNISLNGTPPSLLYGNNNENVHILDNFFKSKIIARGENITIEGEDTESTQLEKIFNALIQFIRAGNTLTKEDVTFFLDFSTHNNGNINPNVSPVISTSKIVVRPRTFGQHLFVSNSKNNDILFAIGPAGTGKTFLAICMAVNSLLEGSIDRIILTRPAIETGESLGYLPGDLKEKLDPYLHPLYDALFDILSREKIQKLLKSETIEITPLGYMRGRTLNNAYIILDEAQNATSHQLKMFLTRLGTNSKAIINGDITQIDLNKRETSGLLTIPKILQNIDGIKFVYLDKRDIIRHRLVKDIVRAYEKHDNGNKASNNS